LAWLGHMLHSGLVLLLQSQERNRILEEQVTTLQHQVTALQKSRDAQVGRPERMWQANNLSSNSGCGCKQTASASLT
jgi:hypothetical protein